MRRPRSGAGLLRAASALLASACASACVSAGHLPASEGGGVAVAPESALDFHRRARVFYERLALRRFNTLETFNDPVLRDHFSSEDGFIDYYAELARVLSDAHFERSRPGSVEILEFLFEDEDHVRVQVRFRGEDGRPLRPDRTTVVRRDRWVRGPDGWWLTPQPPEGTGSRPAGEERAESSPLPRRGQTNSSRRVNALTYKWKAFSPRGWSRAPLTRRGHLPLSPWDQCFRPTVASPDASGMPLALGVGRDRGPHF